MAQVPHPPPTVSTTNDSMTREVSDDTKPVVVRPYHEDDSGVVFTFVEEMPKFHGGADSLKKFLETNTKFPAGAGCKEGTVYVHFVIERDGTVTNIKPHKEISGSPELTKEALRVVTLMPKWKSGKMNGKPVRVEMVQPVRFTLQ
jgi:protein TonB